MFLDAPESRYGRVHLLRLGECVENENRFDFIDTGNSMQYRRMTVMSEVVAYIKLIFYNERRNKNTCLKKSHRRQI